MRAPATLLLALLTLPALAGCVDDAGPGGAPAGVLDPLPAVGAAFDGLGNAVPLPEEARGLAQYVISDLGHEGAEPTLGVTSSGAVFVVSDTAVLRSRDHGATWEDVTPAANWPAWSLDPYLWVDVDTDRVFVDHLYVGCSYLMWSDDEGASWLTQPAACGTPVNDHQTLATGRPAAGVTTPLYPNVVYYGYNGLAYTGVTRSLDGGATWGPATVAIGPEDCGGLNGHIKTAPDGTVYVPAAGCDEPVVAVSRDSGLTWEQHVIDTGGAGRSTPGDDPSVALDAQGNAYLVWPGKDARMYGSVSADGGRTWSPAFRVSPPHVASSLFPVSAAGDPGRVAFAYYGTTADTSEWDSVNSADAAEHTRWHLFVTYSLDALEGADATFVTVQVTPDDDPIQVGSIWNGGGGRPDRNLLDFFDMVRDAEGRVFIAYTDGCRACDEPDDSRRSDTMVAVLHEGPSLLASAGVLEAPTHEGHDRHSGSL